MDLIFHRFLAGATAAETAQAAEAIKLAVTARRHHPAVAVEQVTVLTVPCILLALMVAWKASAVQQKPEPFSIVAISKKLSSFGGLAEKRTKVFDELSTPM